MRGEPLPRRPYTIEDFKQELTIDPEAIREAMQATPEEIEEYRRFISDLLLGKVSTRIS